MGDEKGLGFSDQDFGGNGTHFKGEGFKLSEVGGNEGGQGHSEFLSVLVVGGSQEGPHPSPPPNTADFGEGGTNVAAMMTASAFSSERASLAQQIQRGGRSV